MFYTFRYAVFTFYSVNLIFIAALCVISKESLLNQLIAVLEGGAIPLMLASLLLRFQARINDTLARYIGCFIQSALIALVIFFHVTSLTRFGYSGYSNHVAVLMPSLLVPWLVYAALLLTLASLLRCCRFVLRKIRKSCVVRHWAQLKYQRWAQRPAQ